MAVEYWRRVVAEHDLSGSSAGDEVVNVRLSDHSLYGLGTHFRHTEQGGVAARAIFARVGPLGFAPHVPFRQLIDPNNLYVGSDPNASGCGNNWARGYYTEGAELSKSLLELTRREAERTDAMGSIVLYHAASGGTGGGAGSAVLARLREEYPEVHLATCTVLPSFKAGSPYGDVYNSVLTMAHLVDHVDACFVLNNESVYDLWHQRLKQRGEPRLGDFNKFYGGAMAGVTHTLRFPTLPTTTTSGDCYYPPASLRHLCDQLVMPAGGGNNLHFLSLSRTLCVEEQPLESKRLVEQLWTSSSLTWWPLRHLGDDDDRGRRTGRTLGSFAHFQLPRSAADRRAAHPVADAIAGEVLALHSAQTVDQADADLQPADLDWCAQGDGRDLQQQRRGFTFGDLHSRAAQPWSEVRVSHDSAAWPAARVTGTLVAHSTTIARPLNNINDMFNAIFKRKAFLSWYISEGMDESEFVEAGMCLTDLIHAYQAHERPQHTTTASSTSSSS